MANYVNKWDTAGSYSITLPTDYSNLVIQCWAGGGSGGAAATPEEGPAARGGGGGGGGFAQVSDPDMRDRVDYEIHINVGGGGVASSSVNGGGSNVYYHNDVPSSVPVCSANGGGGVARNATAGGAGGAGTVGDILYTGGNGANSGTFGGVYGGGGGGGAGSNANGSNASTRPGGAGGASYGGDGGDGASINGPGTAGSVAGGGGGGAADTDPSSDPSTGGAGAGGRVYISYDYNLSVNRLMNVITSFGPYHRPNIAIQYTLSFKYTCGGSYGGQELGVWIYFTDATFSKLITNLPSQSSPTLVTTGVTIQNNKVVDGVWFGFSQPQGAGSNTKWFNIDEVNLYRTNGVNQIPNGGASNTTDWINATSGVAQYWTSNAAAGSTITCAIHTGESFTGNHQYFYVSQNGETIAGLKSNFGFV